MFIFKLNLTALFFSPILLQANVTIMQYVANVMGLQFIKQFSKARANDLNAQQEVVISVSKSRNPNWQSKSKQKQRTVICETE